MFKTEREDYQFKWEDIGDIEMGRPNLGNTMNVAVYRLMQYSMRDVMIKMLSVEKANEILREAGSLAGREFCLNVLDRTLPFGEFISQLQEKLLSLKIGILRIEKSDLERMEFILTVDEDLDCSGLPLVGETVCEYDEGFIAGILDTYTGKRFNVREIDCWASGERTCRFKVVITDR
jgi:predicted hydrocarbon binding protein